jgi:Mrp family chromosome partitioning ATPase/capsular polysaccharide biosynthesis protein
MMIQPTSLPRVHETIVSDPIQSGLRIHPPSSPARVIGNPNASPEDSSGIKIFSYLKYRWVTVLFLGGLLGTVMAFAAWKLIPSKYTTYAMIRVSVEDPKVYLQENPLGRSDFATYLKTQADMIRSWQVLNGAIRDPEVADSQILKEQIDPIKFLEEELKIEVKDGSEIMKLLLSGEDPKAITNIVNSILQAYDREVLQEELKKKKYRLQLLDDSIQSMQKDVNQMYGNRKIVKDGDKLPKEDLPSPINPQLATSELLRHKQTLSLLEAELKALTIRKEKLIEKQANPTPDPKVETLLIQQADTDPKIATLNKEIETLKTRLDYDLNTLMADPKHPLVIDKKQRMEEATKERDQLRAARIEEIKNLQGDSNSRRNADELEQINNGITTILARKEQAEKLVAEFQKIVDSPVGTNERPPDFYFVDMKEREGIIKGMIDKANQLRVEINAPPRVRLIPAAVPVKKEVKKQLLGTAAAGLLGFALVGFLVVAYEARINRALSLTEVQQSTLGPVLGVIPSAGRAGPNVRSVAPAAVAEAVDKLRTQLQQQFDNASSKVIMLCSALKDEGRSYLTIKLGDSFLRSGAKVLLIDFDLRSPTLHRRLKLQNEIGLCEVLRNETHWKDALQATDNGMSILAAGKWNQSLRVELSPERLLLLFSRLREEFDMIVVNTHALLPVAETYLAARYADALLLCVEKYESRLPFVTRTQDKIAQLSPEAFGVVFLGASEEECLI